MVLSYQMRRQAMCVLFLVMLPCFHAIAQQRWEPVDMPPCAEVVDVVQSGDTIIAQAEDCWRSEDAGRTWERFAQREDGRLYRAFGRIWSMDLDTLYLYDRAAGWQPVTSPFASYRVLDVLVVGDTVYVESDTNNRGSVWMSVDPSGSQWTNVSDGLPPATVMCLGARNDGHRTTVLCCASNYGAYELDASGTWHLLSGAKEVRWLSSLTFTGSRYLAGDLSGSVYESMDGKTWMPSAVGGTLRVNDIAVEGARVCAATNGGLYISEDRGATWRRETIGMGHLVATCVDLTAGRIACGNVPHGVFVSDDGGFQWRTSDMIDPVYFTDALDHDGELILVHGRSETFFRRTASGWERFSVPSEAALMVSNYNSLFSHDGILFYLKSGGASGLWRSSDDGVTWMDVDSLPLSWYSDIVGDGADLFVATESGIARSSDDGVSWTQRDARMLHQPSSIAAGGGNLYVANQYELRHSTDDGEMWNGNTLGLPLDGIGELVADDSLVAANCFGAAEGPAFVKRHADPEFRNVETGAMSRDGWIRSMFLAGVRLYAGHSDGGIYRADPDKRIWELWTDGLPADRCRMLLGIAGSKIYATDTLGMLRSRSIDMVNAVDVPPAAAALDVDVWPQPARDLLHVRIAGSGEPANLVLADLLGREILRHSITSDTGILNLEGLPRGVYRLTVSGATGKTGRNVIKY